MFHKLHWKMTIFSTMITGIIVLVLSGISLLFVGDSMRESNYASFLSELDAAILHLQEQDIISHTWLSRLQADGHFRIYLYNNNQPFSYQGYHTSPEEYELVREVLDTADRVHYMDIFAETSRSLPVHTEFDYTDASGSSYYISAGIIPKEAGHLSFLILYQRGDRTQLLRLFWWVLLADVAAICALLVFSWFFTGRMIHPLENNQKRQTDFIASASHELRAPLAVIRSGLEACAKADTSAQRTHFMDLMAEEGTRMAHLVDDMLLLANSDSGSLALHMGDYQPDEVLLSVFEKYEPLAHRRNIALRLSLPDRLLPDCRLDRERLTQVLSILIDNALSYTPEGGEVSLELSYIRKGGKPDGQFRFAVSDNGCGVADEDKKAIFRRFYRAEQSHTNKNHFGLGLCIARELITAMHGHIWVEDAHPQGAVFFVTLPDRS
ncbi:MAG: HAMP domain-containing histidine kinase [Lachnospiraceae bacterium]|nr:HAMP domain-containing histidine kinase [Lachnospiraceae bacterium]